MNGFASFVRKETLHIFRDPRTMLIALLMPVVQILLFGFALSTEVNNVDVAVVAPHRSETVRQAVERMAANPNFTFTGYIPSGEIDRTLRSGRADAVAVFAGDFDRRMADLEAGRPDTGAALQLVMDASNTNTAQAGAAYLRSVLLDNVADGVGVETRLLYNPRMKSAYNFVPGIMGLIFILICAIMTSVSIVREKETGTMEVLLVSPVRPIRIVFAKMIPYFVLSCLNLASILLLARFVLGVPMSGGIVGIVGLSLLYIVLALALGLFISTVARTQVTALLVSAMLMLMPMIMLSGMVFPIGNMPAPLRWLSCIVPARWYIAAIRRLMIEGLPFTAVLREFAILAAMTAGLIAVALRKFNDKLE
ncbi:ABC transporter permease [uncultured Alistipes sp.]|uniref:ABC transporter permease n=1 Tax=uncultured Alistipes sp. TaxID=538949 RepID=UPI000E825B0B|nr:ABC transporter permease [uncultured Alistipes sp.]HBL69953.1 multidrug ABC transporter permease [Alistipes sp.]HBW02002.1 multidrug ABC transporter permease [Alistipes sp.]